MTALNDHTTPQLVEAALGDLDAARGGFELSPRADDHLLQVQAILQEIARRDRDFCLLSSPDNGSASTVQGGESHGR